MKTKVIVTFARAEISNEFSGPGWIFDLLRKLLPFLKIIIVIEDEKNELSNGSV